MEYIYNFCKDSQYICVSTEKVEELPTKSITIDIKEHEIKCSRFSKTDYCIFNLNLDFKSNINIDTQIFYMRTIEIFYPNMFSWHFNGNNIVCIAKIPLVREYLGIFTRFGGINNFISKLRRRLLEVIKYREFTTINISNDIEETIFCLGSVNKKTDFFVIDINPFNDKYDILMRSRCRNIQFEKLETLDMKYWVKEINPDFYKEPITSNDKKYSIDTDIIKKYPPCIKMLSNQKQKGNYGRFLLSTFLLKIHNERDAKHQLDLMLTDEEREHMNNGNCKHQWRTIIIKGYAPPSCKKMIETGYCTGNCGRPAPYILDN